MNLALRRCSLVLVVALLGLAGLLWRPGAEASPPILGLTLGQGFNLIADPNGAILSGPAYTLQMNDTAYEVVQPGTPLVAGLGYWVLARDRSALPLASGTSRATIQAPAGRYVMIGDPSGVVAARVSGADLLWTYDPQFGYHLAGDTLLLPGQGAFALSFDGGPITMTAEGSATGACSTADRGSACPVNGACPSGYPVAITNDANAHPAPAAGEPVLSGRVLLCFNDISQALAAGYQLASPFRVSLAGGASAVTDNVRITIKRALLETPQAFVARAQAGGEQLCGGCSCCQSAITAILTVDYEVENLDRPPTAVDLGTFKSVHYPPEVVFAATILADQHLGDIYHAGVSTDGSISAAFSRTKFSDIDVVNWQVYTALADNATPMVHGPNILFELDFGGPRAGQLIAYGGGTGVLQPFNPNTVGAPGVTTTCFNPITQASAGCTAAPAAPSVTPPPPLPFATTAPTTPAATTAPAPSTNTPFIPGTSPATPGPGSPFIPGATANPAASPLPNGPNPFVPTPAAGTPRS